MISTAIKKAIANGSLAEMRSALRISLTLDNDYVSGMYVQDSDYCRKQGITDGDLYEKYDGRDLLVGIDTEDSFTTLLGHLSTNFAKERVERILALGKKLWPQEQQAGGTAIGFERPTQQPKDGTGSVGSERILGERIVGEKQKSTVNSARKSTGMQGERIIFEREIPSSGGYGRHSHSPGRGSKNSNFPVAVAVGVVAAAVVVAIVLPS